MKYLNSTDGRQIRIFNIIHNKKRIKYSIAEYGGDLGRKLTNEVYVSPEKLIDYETQETKTIGECYTLLAVKESDFSVSEDPQNWIFPIKPIRVFVDNEASAKEMAVNAPYLDLIQRMQLKHEGFILVDGFNSCMYVDSLAPEDVAIIADFINTPENPDGWIFTEPKT